MKLFNILCFVLLSISQLYSQNRIYYGSPKGVSAAIFRQNAARALTSVVEFAGKRGEIKSNLEKARKDYWELYPNIKNNSSVALEYFYWLQRRDMYYFERAIANKMEERLTPNRYKDLDYLDIDGMFDLLERVTGGRPNELLEPYALNAHNKWIKSMFTNWGSNDFISDAISVRNAFDINIEEYSQYFDISLKAEYLFQNQNSPLLIDNSTSFLKAYLSLFENSFDTEKYYNQILKYTSDSNIEKAIIEFKAHFGEENWLQAFRGSTLRPKSYDSSLSLLEWFIAKNSDPKFYSLYLIKRRFLCNWNMAENILNNRTVRYSDDVVKAAISKVWQNRENELYRCIGNPFDNGNYNRMNSVGLNRQYFLYNEDCLCHELAGQSVLWNDLSDLSKDVNQDDLSKEITNINYKLLESVLSKKTTSLISSALYLTLNYEDIFYLADQFGIINYDKLKKVDNFERPPFESTFYRILDGLASVNECIECQLLITVWKHQKREYVEGVKDFNKKEFSDNLKVVLEDLQRLFDNYGHNLVLQVFENYSNDKIPDPFSNLFTFKSRWLTYERFVKELGQTSKHENASKDIQSHTTKKRSGSEKEERDFLFINSSRPEVITTNSGLQYEIIHKSDNPLKPMINDKVKVHYHGTLINGNVFDSSVERGEPISFPLNNVIKGWQEGLQLMNIGSKYRLFVPYHLAYGEGGVSGKIAPYATLIFDVELLGIE